jgi:phosphoserine aminotransferase
MAGKVFKWLKKEGGLEAMKKKNHLKAETFYSYLDNSSFFSNPVKIENRSIMNVPFILDDKSLDSIFLEQAEERGLMNLKGHRSVGGMRASIYNAMPMEGVHDLIDFMKDFEKKNG